MKATAVLLAGSRPGGDPLAAHFGAASKALIPLGGQPMILRPLAALLASADVGEIILLAHEPDALRAVLPPDRRVRVERSGATIAGSIAALCADPATRWPLLITTADHALLDAATIDEFLRSAGGSDVAVGVVEEAALMARLPGTRRTWLRFRGGAVTGANLFALKSATVAPAIALWRLVEQDRKKGWRVILLAGPVTLAGAALRLLSLDQVMARVGKRIGLAITAVRLSNPLAGVDVDTVDDHRLVSAILAGKR